jgi:sterol desaturase/sphingolipid hydroxylase (fatty acid hydroxylase superfamily)
MGHMDIVRSKEPIRLFKSDFLEFFTHIRPAVVVAIWGPIALAFLAYAIVGRPPGLWPIHIPLGVLAGLFLWTLAEYALHRFVFHFPPRSPRQERISFLFHGVHHAQPMVKTRLVMPPAVSVPLALAFYGLFWVVLGVALDAGYWIAPTFSGFIAGYLAYDMLHYSTHHVNLRSRTLRAIRRHHMLHHSQTPDRRFGVSSPLWDYVFGTEPG